MVKFKTLVKLNYLFIIVFSLSLNSCKKEEPENNSSSVGTDEELLNKAKVTTGFTWFENSDTLLKRSTGSGHPQAFLRTRYNSVAAAKLDSDARIKDGTNFPEGSLIVKELYSDSTTLARYAILFKESAHDDADAQGWVWGYVDPDGTVGSPASNKGGSCIGCHSQSGNIDYMLMNKFYP